MRCPLCKGSTIDFYRDEREFARCTVCKAIMLLPRYFLTAEEEEKRYLLHNNNVEDLNYLHFISPITNAVQEDFPVTSTFGLWLWYRPGSFSLFKKTGVFH
ncbi:hypothetical protein LZ575_05990 [Antarcticibacterium sp. 1MA-6-2]|uniref:hypothetical protein n=1 Tax=Antarcticibacterium sp. 1MA-6-2 TaxID=2908210 RepID=UPI001F1EA093|nr:hypothetical protein [Antarcticibacterium sp. 1MA-6-2]UJH92129.1 hypothetical protein LZ575_05990 [Antarcticibacterium sp. 1MA-6-2]